MASFEHTDAIQQHLTTYAQNLNYLGLSPEAVHAAKLRLVDNLGALLCGFFGDTCVIARNLAAQIPSSSGATVIGTRMKTTPDMAAFVNATTARYPELTDSYHWPGTFHGHPSTVVTPVLAAGEYAHVDGRTLITGIVLAYEVFLRFSDVFRNQGFDNTNFSCIGVAVSAGKLFGLDATQLAHCISMAVVPNVVLRQIRLGHLSMYKAAAAGHVGRAGVFAAMLAKAGMEGPHLPFSGKAGWCEHVAGERFTFGGFGGGETRFKILDTQIKNRASKGNSIACILASEKLAPLRDFKRVERVTVEVYKAGKVQSGTGAQHWNPQSREAADHSIPYVVAATLIDGTVTPRSYGNDRLWNPELRRLMQKIEIVENAEFTQANEQFPQQHHARVTVVTAGGEHLVAKAGGDQDDLSSPKSDAQIEEKFRGLTEEVLGTKRVNAILDRLWNLEQIKDVAEIPPMFVLA